MLLAGQWEGFTQASQLQGLAVTTNHQPLPSVEDQLCSGRVVVLQRGLAVYLVRWPWGFPGGAGQGQPPPVFCPGPPLIDL